MKDTKQQFEHVIAICRDLFAKKLHDYGAAWRIMRPSSVTDQIFIKANRIRSIEIKGVTMVDEGIRSEFIAIVNYGIIGLIQLELGYADTILMKSYRTKQIEGHDGATLVSEGIDANYMDMINYSVFGLIKLEFGE